jgi:HTH-type transcriptional regulator / antitoxin HigA
MSAAVEYGDLLAESQPEVVHADEQGRKFTERLAGLLVKDQLNEAEEKLVELLTFLIESYEEKRYPGIEKTKGIEVVKYLMEHHDLKNRDLVPSVFETESVASETLRGNRDLTLKHIKRLSERFHLSTDVFID